VSAQISVVFYVALLLPIAGVIVGILTMKKFGLFSWKNLGALSFLIFTFLVNPVMQVFFFEKLDTDRNNSYAEKARQAGIIGKSTAQITSLFGRPESISSYGSFEQNGKLMEGYTCWEYKPLPGYWLGSHFQVFFRNGIVSSFEANDD
jgi:hypothetical protein